MSWTITTPGGGGDFASFAIHSAKRNLRNLAIDTFTFVQDCDVTNVPICGWGDYVIIKNGGVTWFQGICTAPKAKASGKAESIEFVISGAWWWLENTALQVPWLMIDGSQVNKGRVILGVNADLTAASIASVFTAVFTFLTTTCRAPVALGTCTAAACAPPKEVLDVTCAEVIRAQLKYAPDVVGWVNYAPDVPTINFAPRAALTPVTVSFTNLTGFEATPRPDLIPPEVVLIYETTNTVDGRPGITVQVDASPVGALGYAPRSLVTTIPLHGVTETYAKQKVRVQLLPLDVSNPTNTHIAARFYQMFCTALQAADKISGDPVTPDLTFYPSDPGDSSSPVFVRALAQPVDVDGGGPYILQDPTDTSSTHVYLDTTLTKCLMQGSVMPWMTTTSAQVQSVTFRCSWKENGVQKGLNTDGSLGVQCVAILTATNAVSLEYHSLQQYEAGESAPTGLAAALRGSLSTLQYEGKASYENDEVDGALTPGKLINVSGARAEWVNMAERIQTTEEDIDKGATSVTFGPPNHLAIQDVIELLRSGRPPDWDTRAGAANSQVRNNGLL